MASKSPTNAVLDYLVTFNQVKNNAVRSLAEQTQIVSERIQTTFVFRPGAIDPIAPIYNDFSALYAAFILTDGPRIVQIDDSIVSPAVIPAGTYTGITTLVGTFKFNNSVICNLSDGVSFPDLVNVVDKLALISFSTSIPVLDISSGQRNLIIERGAAIRNDPTSTVPFVNLNSPDQLIIVCLTGGEIGSTGIHCVQIGAGSNLAIILDIFGSLANDVLVGPGNCLVIITSQSALINTPNPQLQPAITGTFMSILFDFANNVSFQNLTSGDWAPPPPANVEQAINRLSAAVVGLLGGQIP